MNQLSCDMIKEQLHKWVTEGQYEQAEQALQVYLEKNSAVYDDVLAIYEADISRYFGDGFRMWEAIRRGLCINPRNYELYVMLGNYYLDKNQNQTWLCYENALFYCDNEEDRQLIQSWLRQLTEEYVISIRRVAIVILSWNLLEYTKLCIESIRQTVPESARQLVVVDNASTDGSVEWLREQEDIVLIENKENKGFPIGCNQGIAAADDDTDIFLLNNDTIMPENALFWLRMGLYASEENGTAGAISNCVGNNQKAERMQENEDMPSLFAFAEKNNVPMKHPYEKKLYLIGFALLIRRNVLEQVGLLDERFTPGNFEDNDYGLRVLEKGYSNILCKNSFIVHFGNKSFAKRRESYGDLYWNNKEKLDDKWGFHVGYYMHPRQVLAGQIEESGERAFRVLDVGCGCGAFLGYIKGRYENASVYGIELSKEAARFAMRFGDVICGDVQRSDFPWPEEFFDYIVFGDVLEHLQDAQAVLKRLYRYLKRGGHIIVSMPNVRHYSVIIPLLFNDEFSYQEEGILDKTHLKLYTGTEIVKLVTGSGYHIERMEGITRGESEEDRKRLEKLLADMGLPDTEKFFFYQYLIKAVKRE